MSKKIRRLIVLSLISVSMALATGCGAKSTGKEAISAPEDDGNKGEDNAAGNEGVVESAKEVADKETENGSDSAGNVAGQSENLNREDAKKYFPDEKMLTQSSNLKVFRSYENQEFEYSCVFVPYDGSDFAFLFETDISPEAMDFGFGFRDCIHYYVGGEEVFPDTELDRSVFENT